MVILSLNTIDSSEAYKQIPIYRADNSVKSHTFLLFLSAFAHLFTVLSHKTTSFDKRLVDFYPSRFPML